MNLSSNRKIAKTPSWYWSVLLLFLAILFFLFSIDLVGGSLTRLGQETAQSILLATSNPFIGLFIGLLITALIQSSSTVTAMTVAVVASGYLNLANAIPIIMGANVGTTLTSTLVSLGFITKKNEFRKAISTGTVHDFFNISVVILLFPLEYYYGFLSELSQKLSVSLSSIKLTGERDFEFAGWSMSRLSDGLLELLPNNFLTIVFALVILFLSIKLISRIIYTQLIGASKDRLRKFVFDNPFKSFGWGTLITAGVQSSSITTSIMVPLAASGRVSVNNSFPFIMGANIGTTITALLAAFNKSDAAMSIAMAHLLFNLIGVLVFLPFPFLRNIPVKIAYRFGAWTLDSRIIGFSYIVFTFFLLPFTLIYFSKDSVESQRYVYEITEGDHVTNESIVINSDKVKDIDQFLVYHGEQASGQKIFTIPDTTFQLQGSDERFAMLRQLTSMEESSGKDSFGAFTQHILGDTSQYTFENNTLSGLIALERNYIASSSEVSKMIVLVDPVQRLFVKAEYFRGDDSLIKSERLKSQE